MATASDIIRSTNLILQAGRQREQDEVSRSLAMLQLASEDRRQAFKERQLEIDRVGTNLETSNKLLEQSKITTATAFGNESGLFGFSRTFDENKTAEDAISDLSKDIKKQLGKGYRDLAPEFAGALYQNYNLKDPSAFINLGERLHTASLNINNKTATREQKRLFEAFQKLGATSELQNVSRIAFNTKKSQQNVIKEYDEFLQGDYEIQSPIGMFADFEAEEQEVIRPADTSDANVINNLLPAQTSTQLNNISSGLKLAQDKFNELDLKMDSGTATDEEKEEYYELPKVIKSFETNLQEAKNIYDGESTKEIAQLEDSINRAEESGLANPSLIRRLQTELRKAKSLQRATERAYNNQIEMQNQMGEIERISTITGIPTSELVAERKRRQQERAAKESGQMPSNMIDIFGF